jgi:hypothetical protein
VIACSIKRFCVNLSVVDFLTNAFPDLYLSPVDFGPEEEGVDWDGRGEADKGKVTIIARLVLL